MITFCLGEQARIAHDHAGVIVEVEESRTESMRSSCEESTERWSENLPLCSHLLTYLPCSSNDGGSAPSGIGGVCTPTTWYGDCSTLLGIS